MLLVFEIVGCDAWIDQVEMDMLFCAALSLVEAIGEATWPVPGRLRGSSKALLDELGTGVLDAEDMEA